MKNPDDKLAARLAQLCDELNVAIIVVSYQNGRLLYINHAMHTGLGKPPEQLENKHYKEAFSKDFADLYEGLAKACADGRTRTRVFYWEEFFIWEQVAGRMITWLDGTSAMLLTITNITEVSRSEYAYKQMAYYDPLLQLPNGKKLEYDIASTPSSDRVALIYFDIDRFHSINDLYGWDAGDALLMQMRDWILATRRKGGRLYRVSDDDFGLLIQDISLSGARDRAQQIVQRFAEPWEIKAHGVDVKIYCTIDMSVVHGKNVRGGVRNLISRTAHADNPHGEGFVLYDESLDRKAREKVHLRQDLINCIQNGMQGFSVHYHPIVDAKSGQWVGAEALCRWTRPDGSQVPPLDFIPDVEGLGMIAKVDDWVRKTALTQCAAWGLADKNFFLDVNLSPFQTADSHFIEALLQMLEKIGYPRHKLTLEITESGRVDFSEANLQRFRHLHNEGIRMALDDFATGYSTFENLLNLPADVVKTEGGFIHKLERDHYLQYLMRFIVELAHEAGKVMIVEGVETEGQRKLLNSYGVDMLQGYLFSKPLPPEEFQAQVGRYR